MMHDTILSGPPGRYAGSRLPFRGPARPLGGRHVAFLGDGGTRGEAFLGDPVVLGACQGAMLTVVEAMGAANLSNRLYTVHPRRNDRFLRASPALRSLYPEVDFAEICFTRHLLMRLREADAERFELVRGELRGAWAAWMRGLLERVGPRVLLLWTPGGAGPLGAEPLFVTEAMVEGLRPLVLGVVAVAPAETEAAAHLSVAAALSGPIRALLGEGLRASA